MKKILTKILLISIILFGFGSINQSNANEINSQIVFNYLDQKELSNPGFVEKLGKKVKKILKFYDKKCISGTNNILEKKCKIIKKYYPIIRNMDSYSFIRQKFNDFSKNIKIYEKFFGFFAYNGKIYFLSEQPYYGYEILNVKNSDYSSFKKINDLYFRDKYNIYRPIQYSYISEYVGNNFDVKIYNGELKIIINGKEYSIDWTKEKGKRIFIKSNKSFDYGNIKINIYKTKTQRKYIINPKLGKNRYLLMKNDNDYPEIKRTTFGGGNIIPEINVKITYKIGTTTKEKVIFEKKVPEKTSCVQDDCIKSIDILGLFKNKLFFTSYGNIINGEYFIYKTYVYDFGESKLIKLSGIIDKIKVGTKGIYYIKSDSNTNPMGGGNKLYLLKPNNTEKLIFDSNNNKISDIRIDDFELMVNSKIKLFLSNDIIQTTKIIKLED